MKGLCLASILLAISINTSASSAIIRLSNGQLAPPGSNVNLIKKDWGRPMLNLRTEETCEFIEVRKKRYCSNRRYIWKKDDVYWMVQYSGTMVVKTRWTRFKNSFREKF